MSINSIITCGVLAITLLFSASSLNSNFKLTSLKDNILSQVSKISVINDFSFKITGGGNC